MHADGKTAISLAIQLRFQYLKHVHVTLDLQIIVVASKINSGQLKGATGESNAGPHAPKARIIPLDQSPRLMLTS